MICKKCNSEIPEGARFCPNCGFDTAKRESQVNKSEETLPIQVFFDSFAKHKKIYISIKMGIGSLNYKNLNVSGFTAEQKADNIQNLYNDNGSGFKDIYDFINLLTDKLSSQYKWSVMDQTIYKNDNEEPDDTTNYDLFVDTLQIIAVQLKNTKNK